MALWAEMQEEDIRFDDCDRLSQNPDNFKILPARRREVNNPKITLLRAPATSRETIFQLGRFRFCRDL